jgi:2-phosphosulfolactate phosphatase
VPEPVFAQPGTGVRFDWGLAGAAELGRVCAVLVVVDVLSFTTSVDVAVGRGMRVHPFPWGAQAEEYARRVGAVARSE